MQQPRISRRTLASAVLCLLSCRLAHAGDGDGKGLPSNTPVVTIERHGEGWRLVRAGQPFTIRGAVGWTRIEELAASGGNTVRTGASEKSLDEAQRHGLSALAGLPLGIPRHGFDYSDMAKVTAQREKIREIVLKLKGHPAILLWAIGNEPTISTPREQRVLVWREVNRLAELVKSLDPGHPVIAVVGGEQWRNLLGELDEFCPVLDAVGLNAYQDMLTLPEDLARQRWKRPYVITEFGPCGHWQAAKTSWGARLEDTSTEKAAFYRRAYEHAVKDRPQCLGAFAFLWGSKMEKTHTWYGMFLDDGCRTEAVDAMRFLWSGKRPANGCPTIGRIQIEGGAPDAQGVFPVGAKVRCSVQTSDPDRDAPAIEWDLRRDVSDDPRVGGDFEPLEPPITGAVLKICGVTASIQLPAQPGKYRVFVYARDGHGGAATANAPILARKDCHVGQAGDGGAWGAMETGQPPAEAHKYRALAEAAAGRAIEAGPGASAATAKTDARGKRIQRTMRLLASSTPQKRNTVKILFYGQSITEQSWAKMVADDLRRRFPHADLVIENRAIGGFASQLLVKTAETDLYPFYPDLVIFHVYGSHIEYENIIRRIRERTTAEILMQTDHLAANDSLDEETDPGKLTPQQWTPWMNYVFLPGTAERYGAELVDQRNLWKRYLRDKGLPPSALLRDGVHLNDRGCNVMAEIVAGYLRYDPELTKPSSEGLVREYRVGEDVRWNDGQLVLEFDGNRIDVVCKEGSAPPAPVRIDGRRPSELAGVLSLTRTTSYPGSGWPCILRIGCEKPWQVEEWTATLTEVPADLKRIRFKVEGSKTGPDGEGVTGERFVSKSGRVTIEPSDWNFEYSQKVFGRSVPPGFQIRWQVVPHFVDEFVSPGIKDPAVETTVSLAQGFPGGKHRLEIAGGPSVPISAIRVYRPPLSAK